MMNPVPSKRLEIVNTVIAAALTVLAYAYGLFFTGGFAPHFAAAFILIAVLLIMGLSQLGQYTLNLRERALPVIGLLWIAGIAATLAMAGIYEVALITSYVLLVFPFALLAFLLLGAVRRQFHACGIALLAAIGCTGIWACIQSFVLSDQFGERAAAPLYNPNNIASLFNLGVLPAAALFVAAARWPLRVLGAVCATGCLLGVFATQSRGGILVAVVQILLFGIVLWRMGLLRRRAGIVIAALLGGLLVGGVTLQPDILARFATLFEAGQEDLGKRVARWQGALGLLMNGDTPVFGLGPGTFYQYFPPHRIAGVDEATSFFAHMDPLQFTIEMGVIGTLIFYLPLLWLIVAGTRLIQADTSVNKADTQSRLLAWAGLIALLGLYAHAHISFPFYVIAILICAAYLLAWIYYVLPTPHQNAVALSLHTVLRGVIIVLILIMATNAGRIGLAQHYTQQAINYSGFMGGERFEKALAMANFYAPDSFNEPRLLALHHKLATGGALPVVDAETPKKLLDTAQAYNPVDPRIPYMRARWLAQKDDSGHLSAHFLRTALDKDPGFFRARKRLIEQYIDDKRYVDAYELVVKGSNYPHKPTHIKYLEKRADWLKQKMRGINEEQ